MNMNMNMRKQSSGALMWTIILFQAAFIALFFLPAAKLSAATDFDFFHFVQQWPGSYCSETQQNCCYPPPAKPGDFIIQRFWPAYNNWTYPSNCNPTDPFDKSNLVSDKYLITLMGMNWPSLACPSAADGSEALWSDEWAKHGTCSGLDQQSYFDMAIRFKFISSIIKALDHNGITPNGGLYRWRTIETAISLAPLVDARVLLECNTDASGQSQLYRVHMCVDKEYKFIDCPTHLAPANSSACGYEVSFPSSQIGRAVI